MEWTPLQKIDILVAFGYDAAPETGPILAPHKDASQVYRERVKQALIGHAERVSAGKARKEREPKKKSGKMDLNQQTKKWLEAQGWKYVRADSWNPYAGVAQDFLGIFDYIAWDTEKGITIGVQVTSKANMSTRRKKILESGKLEFLHLCHWRALVLGFDKGPNGRFRSFEEWL